jgi:hypothetical protein
MRARRQLEIIRIALTCRECPAAQSRPVMLVGGTHLPMPVHLQWLCCFVEQLTFEALAFSRQNAGAIAWPCDMEDRGRLLVDLDRPRADAQQGCSALGKDEAR